MRALARIGLVVLLALLVGGSGAGGAGALRAQETPTETPTEEPTETPEPTETEEPTETPEATETEEAEEPEDAPGSEPEATDEPEAEDTEEPEATEEDDPEATEAPTPEGEDEDDQDDEEGTPDAGLARAEEPVDLDVLFIGAHPDDEAFRLATYGHWDEYDGITTGVITITRGEGGGNAVGPEEGPALGILREAEERRAVAVAGIEHVYNLDEVDFYYTVSSPLTEAVWGRQDALEKVVRVVRLTRPDVIVTMNPAPTPGNHGHHQFAARLAVEAFGAAADPDAFPEMVEDEGLETWRAARLFRQGADGEGAPGPDCAATFEATEPTDLVYGVFSGRESERNDGRPWAAVARDGQREYASQGWAVFPDMPTDPAELECDYFTQFDSRVPFTPDGTEPTAMLEGALTEVEGGLSLGTEFYLSVDAFDVLPGEAFTVTAHVRGEGLEDASVALDLPDGWEAEGDGELGEADDDGERTAEFAVTPAEDATPDTRARLGATLSTDDAEGATVEVVRVAPAVRGAVEARPAVAQFRAFTAELGVPELDNLLKPTLALGSGETREVRVDLTNFSEEEQAGTVTIELPEGFEAEEASVPFEGLEAGGSGAVTFVVTNSDPALPTANEGGTEGDHDFTVTTEADGGSTGTQTGAFNLVPTTTIPEAESAPTVDGVEDEGEYGEAVELDLSRLWEGEPPDSAEDASGTGKVVWADDALYVLVEVTDDTLGTVLPPEDAKRHWRTDSVELAFDPRGDAENTSTTFKVGIFPTTDAEGNPPAAYRDADANQGPIAETAEDMVVASTVSDPYTGYTIEAVIPLEELPAAVDPARFALNVFIYDSDTEDRTGQTRLGWSTFGGVQGDPYRWGRAPLAGYEPPADRDPAPDEPVLPLEVARSVGSPQSILQSIGDGVPLGGAPAAGEDETVAIVEDPEVEDGQVTVELEATGAGRAHVFVYVPEENAGTVEQVFELEADETVSVTVPLRGAAADAAEAGEAVLLVGWEADGGGTTALGEALEAEDSED